MMTRKFLLWTMSMLSGALGMGCGTSPSSAQTCARMDFVKDTGKDATPFLAECLKDLDGKGALKLLPGKYQLLTPLVIDKPVLIETIPTRLRQACSKKSGLHCAVLTIGPIPPQTAGGIMPIEVAARDVRFNSIAIVGAGKGEAGWQRSICLDPNARPLGGGIRVRADGFQMTNVLLKDFGCHTAIEVIKNIKNVKIIGNVIGPNGNHKENKMWSDGVTVHDAISVVIENNTFKDNSDVQLVLGGCRDCRIRNNKFKHSTDFIHASFAELMIHAWPDTSGNFSGSVTSGNSIDCGSYRRCGYGIMIGGEPWYPSKSFGGSVNGNRVTNALLGINVDKLTGPMEIKDNLVSKSGSYINSDCGLKSWPSINISPESVNFVRPKNFGIAHMDTRKCLINRHDR